MIDMPAILLAPAVALTAAWWAELIGLPSAWLRLRQSDFWKHRPQNTRRIALLKDFIGVYIFFAAIFGVTVGLATWLGTFIS